jgi:predicted metalloprotease with PDZ domain
MSMTRFVTRLQIGAALVAAMMAAHPASAQRYSIEYTISMPDPASHLYSIQIFVGGLVGKPVELQMPVWSPGRYARMDFARNVQEFSAVSSDGKTLRWDKSNGSRWVITPGSARSARITYRVFANSQVSGTFSVLDTLHANWNGPSLFMYVEGQKQNPVTLSIVAPENWTVINGEVTKPGQRFFHFPTYDHMVDTPTEVAPAGTLHLDSFVADGKQYRVMLHHAGGAGDAERRRYTRDLEAIVRYQNSVSGAPPIEQYTFLVHLGFKGWDGMEHLTSTQITVPATWTSSAKLLPGTEEASHEYFHVWNVKRVRPAALGPFDYTREQYQPSLWVAEGWTQYFGIVTLRRSGLEETDGLYKRIAAIIQENLTAPGRKEVSARMSSFNAPLWDGATEPQPHNLARTYFDYYTKGAGIATYLDLYMRNRTQNTKSLNDVFNVLKRRSWGAQNASYYLQGRGYTEDDVEFAVGEVGDVDASDWFAKYVGGTEDLDFDTALGWAGLRLVRDQEPWRIEEIPDATPAQIRVRMGWVTGRVDRK